MIKTNKTNFTHSLIFCALFLFLSCNVAKVQTANNQLVSKTQPNVILVMTDDQGYGDLACHGNPIVKTPAIDAFHKKAVRLTDFHVGPSYSATRAGL